MPQLYGKMSAFDIDLMNNRVRTRSTRGRRDQMVSVENNTWVQEIPRTKHLSSYEPTTKTYIPSPRRLALKTKLDEMVAVDRPFWEVGLFFVVGPNKFYGSLRCYFHKNVYVFVDTENKIRSNPYEGKDFALQRHRRGKIFWAEAI